MAFFIFKKNKLWIWKAGCRDTGQLIDRECEGRDQATLKKLINRPKKWSVKLYCADHRSVYPKVIGEDNLKQSKPENLAIERNNCINSSIDKFLFCFVKSFENMKVALVYYWLTGMRRCKRVLEALCRIWPGTDIFPIWWSEHRFQRSSRKRRFTSPLLTAFPLRKNTTGAVCPAALFRKTLPGRVPRICREGALRYTGGRGTRLTKAFRR